MIYLGHFPEDGPTFPTPEGWSVVLEFERSPAEQGETADALVSFLVEGAPHGRLCPGRRFDYYVGLTKAASVEVGEPVEPREAGV